MADIDLRAKLGKYYDLDGGIPSDVRRQVAAFGATVNESRQDQRTSPNKDLVQKVLNDKSISTKDKEYLSASILKGEHDELANKLLRNAAKKELPPDHATESLKQTQFAISSTKKKANMLRYDAQKTAFLELRSSSVEILPAPLSSPINSRRGRGVIGSSKINFNEGAGSQASISSQLSSSSHSQLLADNPFLLPAKKKEIFFFGNKYVEAEERPIVSKNNMKQSQQSSIILEAKNFATAKYKRESVLKQREEILELKRQSELLKKLDKIENDKKNQLKKTGKDFRKMLIGRLKSQSNNQLSDFARCVDEDAILEFLEKYRGYSMSLEGVISMLSAPLGKSVLAPAGHDSEEILIPGTMLPLPAVRDQRHFHAKPMRKTMVPGDAPDLDFDPPELFNLHVGHSYQRDLSPSTVKKYGSGFQFASREGTKSASGARMLEVMAEGRSFENNDNDHLNATLNVSLEKQNENMDEEAINVVRAQMQRESTLPSLQPLKVLTDEQLTKIGSNKKELERILNRILPAPGVVTFSRVPVVSTTMSPVTPREEEDEANINDVIATNEADDDWRDILKELEGQNNDIDEELRSMSINSAMTDNPSEVDSLDAQPVPTPFTPIPPKPSDAPFTIRILESINPVTAPKSIKTVMDDVDELTQNDQHEVIEFSNRHPKSPYRTHPGSIPEATIVLASGIPAGAGMSLWAPKRRNINGRWVPGKKTPEKPFISAA